MTYITIAYRWGNVNESHAIYASASQADCIQVADEYADYRGGKYGCAVWECTEDKRKGCEGEELEKMVYYTPSMTGENKPKWNHRCDVFNGPICAIRNNDLYATAPEWIRSIIEKAIEIADRMNAREK